MSADSSTLRSLLDRQPRLAASAPDTPAASIDAESEYTPFANGRVGTRPQLALVFRKADGSVKALMYSHLYSLTSDDPAKGFTAEFSQTKVTVKGLHLDPLFRLLCQHRVAEITESPRSQAFDAPVNTPVVHEIIIATGRT